MNDWGGGAIGRLKKLASVLHVSDTLQRTLAPRTSFTGVFKKTPPRSQEVSQLLALQNFSNSVPQGPKFALIEIREQVRHNFRCCCCCCCYCCCCCRCCCYCCYFNSQ